MKVWLYPSRIGSFFCGVPCSFFVTTTTTTTILLHYSVPTESPELGGTDVSVGKLASVSPLTVVCASSKPRPM